MTGTRIRQFFSSLGGSCWSPEKFRLNLVVSLIVAGALIILGFSFSALVYFIYASTGTPVSWKQAFSVGLTQWWAWSFLYLIIFRVNRKIPFERQRWLRSLSIYSLMAIVMTALKLGIDLLWINMFYSGNVPLITSERSLLAMMAYFNFLTFWVFVGMGQALNFYHQIRDGELKASQLETQLAQSQLQALRMQLQPHFLFNTLHTISMLNLSDPRTANRMISRLSDLLRLTLDNAGTPEIALKEEIEVLKRYLEIQEIRFQDRLTVSMNIDPASLDARVPNLILQPIVENAIKHGIADRETSGRIEINTSRQNGWLQLRVLDNGSGLSTDSTTQIREGIGLSNTRARLEKHFGSEHLLELSNGGTGGLEVLIRIPFRDSDTQKADNGTTSGADHR